MLRQRNEVLTVTARQNIYSSHYRARKDHVIISIARDLLDLVRGLETLSRDSLEELPRLAPLLVCEPQLSLEHSLQLYEHVLRKDELERSVDCVLDESTRWAVSDQGRDEYVRVENDPVNQPRSLRT